MIGNFISSVMSMINNNTDSIDEDVEKKYRRYKYLNAWIQTIIPTDYFKIIIIVLLLGVSMLLYSYEPSPLIKIDTSQTGYNISQNNEEDDNPYGFHPFYNVHKRMQYINPAINLCNGIEPKKTLLLTILSRASNVHIREAIRQTWGAVRVYNDIEIRTVFIVGVDDGMLKQIEI
jgi:hypothetical protein